MICKASIFGKDEDDGQQVWLEFEYFTGWNTPEKLVDADKYYHIDFCKVLTPICIKCSDLVEDVRVAVATALGEEPENVFVDCDIETQYVPEFMFV